VNETASNKTTAAGTAKLVYILYLVSLLIGITAIVGLIIAYVNRDDAPGWLQSHYQFQIRTFWIGAFYMIVGIMLLQFLIGLLILLFFIFWLIVRCARGIKYLDKAEAYPEPGSWMF
jgi:uncharacterized membrane protein